MADQARLTIVIEEPTITVSPGGGTPADDFPAWYPRFRELRNRADMGGQLSDAERSEMSDLGRRLSEFANQPAPQQPPAMGPPAGEAVTAAAPRSPATGLSIQEDRARITAGLPPVPEGHKRFYHGGVPYDESEGALPSGGGRWVTDRPEYARDFRSGGRPNQLNYVDVPLSYPALAGNDGQMDPGMPWSDFLLPHDAARGLTPFTPPLVPPPAITYRAPSPAPPGWNVSPAGPVGGAATAFAPREMRPNPDLDAWMDFGPPKPPAGNGPLVFGEPDDEDRPFVLTPLPVVAPAQPPTIVARGPAGTAHAAYPVLPPGGAPELPPIPLAGPTSAAADAYAVAPPAARGANLYVAGVAARADARSEAKVAAEARAEAAAARDAAEWEEREAAEAAANDKMFDQATAGRPSWVKAAVGAGMGASDAAAVGGSAAAGAGAGALAAAGGPVGMALALKELTGAIENKAIDGVKSLGDTAKKVAGNDYMGAFEGSVGKAADAFKGVGLAGDLLAIPLKAAAAGVTAFSDAADAFVARGRELRAYSGSLAGAATYQDVSRFRSDVREAEVIGPETAKLTQSMANMESMFREGFLPVKEFVVGRLAGVADITEEVFKIVLNVVKDFPLASAAVKEWAARVIKALEGDPALIDPIRDWLGAADGLGAGPSIPSGTVRRGADAIGPLPIFTR